MPHELWKEITISGKEIDFSKDGSMQIPKKGVLNMQYVIQEIDVDLENLDGSHQLMLEWPWHLYVAEQIVEKVVNDLLPLARFVLSTSTKRREGARLCALPSAREARGWPEATRHRHTFRVKGGGG